MSTSGMGNKLSTETTAITITIAPSKPLLLKQPATCKSKTKKKDAGLWRKARRPRVTARTIDTRDIKISRGCVRPRVNPGTQWEDPCFPREMAMEGSSLEGRAYRWMRPKEFCEKPVLVNGVPSRHDVVQGSLGNCWMMATLAGIADYYPALQQLIGEKDYAPSSSSYDGVFHSRLWHYGQWVDVYVDDYLPVRVDPTAPRKFSLIGARSPDPNVLWVALVEKALAKFHGSYHSIEAREREYGWRLMTGGVPTILKQEELQRTPSDTIFSRIQIAMQHGCIITCSRRVDRGRLHAYTVTGARKHSTKGNIVRIRNPWGEENANISWLNKPESWPYSADEDREEFECEQGEFWMMRGEFWREFTQFCIGSFKADFFHAEPNILDEKFMYYGEWKGDAAAGANKADVFNNPKFQLTVKGNKSKEKKVLVELAPRPVDDHGVCIYLYKITKLKKKSYILCEEMLIDGSHPVGLRGGCPQYKHLLTPATYMLVPLVANKAVEKQFCMRIYSNSKIKSKPISGTCFHFENKRTTDVPSKRQHYPGSWKDLFVDERTFASVIHKMPQYHLKTSVSAQISIDLVQEYRDTNDGIGVRIYELSNEVKLPVSRDFIEKEHARPVHHPSVIIGSQNHSIFTLEPHKSYLLLAFPWNSTRDKCYTMTLGMEKTAKVQCKLMN